MSKFLLIRLVAALVAIGALGACVANPRPRVGVEYVVRGPPAERVEVVSAAPGTEYVWVKGHWGWRHNDYEWIAGHWAIPERGFREWVPGRWERDRNGWFFVEGRWR
ncbi:MAG: YXWGXW repeat-containing protein [bacterium]